MKAVRGHFVILTLVVVSVHCACSKEAAHETQEFIMGTIVRQQVYGAPAPRAAQAVTARLRELEKLLSFFDPGSDIAKLNAAAGGSGVRCRPETLTLLEQSLAYARLSDGAFNVMVGPLVKRWKVTAQSPDVPPPAEIAALRRLIDYRDCTVDRRSGSARLARVGQMVDLGGIAKGYASDEAVAIYRAQGIRSAIIDIGGNIGLVGSRPDGSPWRVGVQDPEGTRGRFIGYLALADKALSTSGGYERFFEKGGKRYSHIIDPRTGYPAESGLVSVTIVAPSSVESDALSTAVFVLGLDAGLALVRKRPGVEALCITAERTIVMTPGLRSVFSLTAPAKNFEIIVKER